MPKKCFLYWLAGLVCLSAFFVSFFWFSPIKTAASSPDHVLILFDSSGSMKYKLGGGILSEGTRKIDIAKTAVKDTVDSLDTGTAVGLRAYGLDDTIDQEKKCTSSKLLVPLSTGNSEKIKTEVDKLQPTGATPIAYSLGLAKEDLKDLSGTRKIILIGDGKETCDGDVKKIAEELGDMDIPIDSFYMGKDEEDNADLKQAAELSGGKYTSTSDAEGFSSAVKKSAGVGGDKKVTDESLVSEKVLEDFESKCKLPTTIGDKVLYEEKELEEAVAEKSQTTGMEVILDFSGSMDSRVSGGKKIDVAKDALDSTLKEVPDGIDLGFRVYGHTVPKSDKEKSCLDTDLLVKFDSNKTTEQQVSAIKTESAKYSPKGWTPIEHALNKAVEDLKGFDNKMILLISDGEETCSGDPVGRMNRLKDEGVAITVHTVGFDVDADTAAKLKAISEATGGKYIDASSADELKGGVSKVIEEGSRETFDCPTLFQNPIKGGPDLDSAVEIEPGTYTFDKYLEKNEYYYFKVPVKSGQLVKVNGLAARPAVKGSPSDGYKEIIGENLSTFHIKFYDEDKQESHKRDPILMNKNRPETQLNFAALKDGYFYMQIGYNLNDVHKDNIFSVRTEDHFDGDLKADSNKEKQVVVTTEFKGGLGFEDEYDAFGIPKDFGGKKISVDFGQDGFRGQFELFGSNGKLIKDAKGENTISLDLPKKDGMQLVLKNTSPIDAAKKDNILQSRGRYADYTVKVGEGSGADDEASSTSSTVKGITDNVKKIHWLVYVGLGAAILIILVVGLILLLKKGDKDKSKKENKKEAGAKDEAKTEAEPKAPDTTPDKPEKNQKP